MTVKDIYALIDHAAPFETQMDSDNSGFLVGSASQCVNTILFALDVTSAVIDEAVSRGAQLIITHHPLMFAPVHSLTDDTCEGRIIRRLVRENISLISAHTNLDQAIGGINDTLAEQCGLTEISGEGFFRCGLLPDPLSAADFAAHLRQCLHGEIRLMGPAGTLIRKVGLCSGGGSDFWTFAADAGCDAFVSGEIRHHHALAMAESGIVAFECGHFNTEEPGIRALALALQNVINTIECTVRIYVSGVSASSFIRQP